MNHEKLRFLFFVQREFHIEVFASLINYIHTNTLGEIAVLTPDYLPSKNGIRNLGARTSILQQHFGNNIRIIKDPYSYKPHITFLADSGYEFVEGLGLLVNIGHGTICKGSFFQNNLNSFRDNATDLICVPGVIHKKNIEKWLHIPVLLTGVPKLDKLFSNLTERNSILEFYDLNPDKTTILLAPTYNKELSLLYHLNKDLRELVPEKFNLIVKMHGITDESLQKKIEFNLSMRENTKILTDMDLCSAMIAADILLTDISSVIYEFLPTDKKLILFDSPSRFSHPKYNPDDLEHKFRDVGYRFSDIDQLPKILDEIENSYKKPAGLDSISRMFISNQNGSSTEITINNVVSQFRNYSKRGSIILIGKSEPEYLKKYRFHYKVIRINEFSLKELKVILPELKGEFSVIVDSRLNLSPLTPDLLGAHLKSSANVGIVVPTISNDFPKHPQRIGRFIEESQEIPTYKIGGPISYLKSGQIVLFDKIEPDVFAVRNSEFDKVVKFLYDTKSTTKWQDFLVTYKNLRRKSAIALDCFAF